MGRFVRMMTLVVAAVFASVATATTVYVSADIGSNEYDGTTPTHTSGNHGPKADLQHGYWAAESAGSTVVLCNSTNVFKGGVTVSKTDYTIRGESREGVKLSSCITLTGKYGAVGNCIIANITFTNATGRGLCIGADNGGYGVAGTVVSNCVFTHCQKATAGGGGAVSIARSDVKFVDCVFEHCSAIETAGRFTVSPWIGTGSMSSSRAAASPTTSAPTGRMARAAPFAALIPRTPLPTV